MRDRYSVNTHPNADIRSRLVLPNSLTRGDTIAWQTWEREFQWGRVLGVTFETTTDSTIANILVAPGRTHWESSVDVYLDTPVQKIMNPDALPTHKD